jgi:hypothetical protein
VAEGPYPGNRLDGIIAVIIANAPHTRLIRSASGRDFIDGCVLRQEPPRLLLPNRERLLSGLCLVVTQKPNSGSAKDDQVKGEEKEQSLDRFRHDQRLLG